MCSKHVEAWNKNLLWNKFCASSWLNTEIKTICLFHLHRQVGMKYVWIWEKMEYLYGKRFGSKIAWANRKEGDRLGAVQSTETGCGGCEGDRARVLLAQAIFELNLFLYKYSQLFSIQSYLTPTRLWRWKRHSVPKRQLIKFRRRGITQKKAYKI